MAVLSLPLSFTNSFWSQDYRRGLEVLFSKLDQVTCFYTNLAILLTAHLRALWKMLKLSRSLE
jgi:hypothetical protein